ncbi:MAG: DNA helicase II / ATP-dependent DNA helicase PcrA [Parcubacteria group bacterium Licking1014_17]|nr:MAG: DNA helicase II / ATP-dependent DNA helicase PcrA [Parcubacteria group bacterium Licking1014_17]
MKKEEGIIFDGLNERQKDAVSALDGPLLILAGAGSGKTKALTHRIANLMANGINPENILAVTFTNKAANEMKERVKALLLRSGESAEAINQLMLGTFHSVCLKILRADIEKLDYKKNFVIYDTDDQKALVKNLMEQAGIDTKRYPPIAILEKISQMKSELGDPESFFDKRRPNSSDSVAALIYPVYQQNLENSNAVDFDDMINLCILLFRKFPETLEKYQDKFRYILIDEYQDTNHAQYVWANMLAKKYKNIAVVGDDAQSIYGWRRADIRNILDFEKDYPKAKVVMLEQNYRSTQQILNAANNLISKNENQKQKNLWTEKGAGDSITVKEANDEREEGDYVAGMIKELSENYSLDAFTVLYRTHAQSRAIEESMLKHGIPYAIVGGVRYYERREVKDILAYLRLALNPRDKISLNRIYNVPTRGIGTATYKKLNDLNIPVADLADIPAETFGNIAGRQTEEIKNLSRLISKFGDNAKEFNVSQLIKYIISAINYENYINDGTEEGKEKWENVKEIFTAAAKFDGIKPPEGTGKFLEEVALIQDTDVRRGADKAVTLMTLHSSKGLEFPVVFIIGLEDGLFPHARTLYNPGELEEERRLCYVGVTRAMEKLHLTFCRERNLYGSRQANLPSRFIFEIPENLVSFIPASEARRKSWEKIIEY